MARFRLCPRTLRKSIRRAHRCVQPTEADRSLPTTADELADLFAHLAAAPLIESPSTLPVSVRDPKDEHILASALGGNADYLITGDDDLLVLRDDQRLGTLQIVTVAEFLAVLMDEELLEEGGMP